MDSKYAQFLIPKIAIVFVLLFFKMNDLNAQNFDYSDALLHEGGKFIDVPFDKVYGQYRIKKLDVKHGHVRCWNSIRFVSDKELFGKCIFYWPLRTSYDSGEVIMNDTTRVRKVRYFDQQGTWYKTVSLDRQGKVELILGAKDDVRVIEWCSEKFAAEINSSYRGSIK